MFTDLLKGLRVILVIVPLLAIHSPSIAQETEDLLEMSLDDLLNIEVTTASKKSESINDAPGIVTTITAQEIEQFGANSLMEVLDRAPSFYGRWSQLFPQNGFAVRGDQPNHVSSHILLLIDGRPIRESILGGFNLGFYTTFPLDAIEQIEIVRGPGSVLYGTNAYAGVVNVITKKKVDKDLKASVGGGSLSTAKGAALTGLQKGDLSLVVSGNVFREDGYKFSAFQDANTFSTGNYGEELYAGNITASYKNFSLHSFIGRNKQGIVTPLPNASQGNYTSKRVFLDVGYEQHFSNSWTATANVTYNRMDDAFKGPSGAHQTPLSKDVVLEGTNYITPFARANLVLGGSVNFQSGKYGSNDGFAIQPYNQTWWNTYFQADYRPVKQVKLITGGQFNKPNGVDLDFVPRFGAIVSATDHLGAKILYGKAFRSAFTGETKFIIPGTLKGTAGLTPEKVSTVDLQIFYNVEKAQLGVTYFHSSQKNLITRKPSPDPNFRLEFANLGNLTSKGVEIETKFVPITNLFFIGSLAYQTSENNKGIEDDSLVPSTMIKTGISYAHNSGISIGVFNSYFSKPGEISVVNPNVANLNPVPESFNFLSANVRFNLPKLLKLSTSKSIFLSFYGTNLLNERIDYPEFIFKRVNSVTGRAGRAVYTALALGL